MPNGLYMAYSRDEAVNYWKDKHPRLQCSYMLEILGGKPTGGISIKVPNVLVPLTGFTIPDAGIEFGFIDNLLAHPVPKVNLSPMSLSFVASTKAPEDSISIDYNLGSLGYQTSIVTLSDLWDAQFHDNGGLLFIPNDARPVIKILRETGNSGDYVERITVSGCQFTFPKYTPNYGSTDVATYTMSVYYSDIEIKC